MAATEFTFLTVDGHGRPLEPGSRASIRSRCMKGVNVRQDSRRSRRKARKASDNVSVAKGTKKSSGSPEPTSSYPLTSCGPLVKSLQLRTDELGFDSSRLPSSILRSVVKYNALLVAAYPLEIYLENAEAQGHRMTDNLTLLNENKTLLESIFLAIHAVDDLCSGDKLSLRSQRLLCIILSSLNNNLHSASTQQSYSTILIILILLFTAESFQDFGAVATHLDGLRRLLELRETKPVSMDSKLLFKIQQIDLRMSMATGLPLHFPFDYPNPHPVCVIIPPSILPWLTVHPALMSCYQTLQALSNHANRCQASKARTLLSWADFQSQISTSQTHLISLGSSHLPVVSEALRLGMLAFLSTLSRSPVRKPRLPNFTSQLEQFYLIIPKDQHSLTPFLLWLMLMGYISTIDTSSSIASSIWGAIVQPDLTWQAAQGMICDLPWIEAIHGEPGERNLRHIQARRSDIGRRS